MSRRKHGDEVLRTEFGLEDGLASTATWGEVIAASKGKDGAEIKLPEGAKASDPFVRILDPATGTGTFLVECVDLIYKTMVNKWFKEGLSKGPRDPRTKALWNAYVPAHLLPRLTGFELMMAPYAIAHVKLGVKLADTGYTFGSDARAQIYLTNALEPAQDMDRQLAFMNEALAHEAKAANEAKETQFTVVIGNPPYSNMSANLTESAKTWIQPFRYVDGERIRERNMLQFERNLNDDYVKFYGYALRAVSSKYFIIGMITNSSFLWSSSLRGFRKNILDYSDSWRIVDLHGASQIGDSQVIAAGDQNVFDIEQTVAISIIKSGGARIFSPKYVSVVANLASKLEWLNKNSAAAASLPLNPRSEGYFLRPTKGGVEAEYDALPKLDHIAPLFSEAIKTGRDWLVVSDSASAVESAMVAIRDSKLTNAQLIAETGISRKKSWNFAAARGALQLSELSKWILPYRYRPFDDAVIFYHPNWIASAARPVMRNLDEGGKNLAILAGRTVRDGGSVLAWIANGIVDKGYLSSMDNISAFPLWLKPLGADTRTLPNIAPAFTARMAALTGLAYDDCVEGPKQGALGGILAKKAEQIALLAPARRERGAPGKSFGPRDLFDYIYAVLHSPVYRARYADYLKSDFARIPLPGNRALFEALVPLGTELVALHLLDVDALPILKDLKGIRLAGSGEARVAHKPEFDAKLGRVTINATRWFESVPQVAWDFHVGGYQPAQKWLRDRAAKGGKNANPGRVLTPDDILHYRRMIVALIRTAELMPKIDTVIAAHGGWPGAFRGMTDAPLAEAAE